ncbi:MAG: DUF2207 domain-containing protein [Anaerolineales bacterium]|nr:DUF2207 domain-containing protein [Anaerolineales bacterium]
MRQHLKKISLVLPLLLLFLLINRASAQVKSFYWDRFDVEMILLENGDMRVRETQTLVFSGAPFTFGFATIPTGSNGNNDGITDIAVSENGVPYTESVSQNPNTYKLTQNSDEVRIDWYFEPTLGEHTYEFTYTVHGGVIVGTSEQGDGDQIFWKAIPPDIPGRVYSSKVTINLPEGVQPQQYTGTTDYLVEGTLNGNTDAVQTKVSENGRSITYVLTESMTTGDLFEVRVQFPHGILNIPVPGWQQQQQRADVYNLAFVAIALLLTIAGPLGVLILWYTKGRDPQLTVVVPDYLTEPPSNLPPAIAGTLIDEKADMRDIISTLVDLAHRGHLTITEEKRDHIFTQTGTGDALRPFERQFLKDIFRGEQTQFLTSLRYKFASKLPKLRKMLYEELETNGFMARSPESVRSRYAMLGWTMLGISFVAFFVLPIALGGIGAAVACIPMTMGLTSIFMLFAARVMPAKTAKGVEEAAKWEAFKNYLQNIERYSNIQEAGDIFEKYLGYATAFGLDRSWIIKFSKVNTTPIPPWYYPHPHHYPMGTGSRPFRPTEGGGSMPTLENMSGGLTGGLESMSKGLTRMLNSSSTILRSTYTSSSGSSGSFSGGFSGGGSFSSGGGGSRGFG